MKLMNVVRWPLLWEQLLAALETSEAKEARAWSPLVRRLSRLKQLLHERCPQDFRSGIATVRLPYGRPRIEGLLFIARQPTPVNDLINLLAERVLGPLALEESWIPPYYIVWTGEELKAAKEQEHEVWREAVRFGVTFYGEHLLNGSVRQPDGK